MLWQFAKEHFRSIYTPLWLSFNNFFGGHTVILMKINSLIFPNHFNTYWKKKYEIQWVRNTGKLHLFSLAWSLNSSMTFLNNVTVYKVCSPSSMIFLKRKTLKVQTFNYCRDKVERQEIDKMTLNTITCRCVKPH